MQVHPGLTPLQLHPAPPAPLAGEDPRAARAAHPGDDEVTISREGQLRADAAAPRDAEPASALTPEEERQVRELQARDREVRAHEQAHKATAGNLAVGGPTYDYERGPDDRLYAVGGEVRIQLREGRTPQESVALAQRARRAALAPARPSGADRAVAAQASRMEARARADAAEEQREELEATPSGEDEPADTLGPLELARRAAAYSAAQEAAPDPRHVAIFG